MIAVGLTGGIGSGKSTVASMLVAHGAILVDADAIAREALEPGRPAWRRVRERFGESVVAPDGAIDRARLAAVVFSDVPAREDLNAIVHPEVEAEIARRLAELASGDGIVVVDIPLLAERGRGRYRLAGVLVVDAPPEVAAERLVSLRGMAPAEVEARMSAQASRAERIAVADFVILNWGSMAELSLMVGNAWAWMEGLAGGERAPSRYHR